MNRMVIVAGSARLGMAVAGSVPSCAGSHS